MSVRNPQSRPGSGQSVTPVDSFDPKTGGQAFGNPNGYDSPLGNIWNFITGRTHQANMQLEQQEFDEYMYNQYNSPAAIKEQFKDAGINTNLIGSTSFGTAQSSAGAPAVNGSANPVTDVASAVESVASAASLAADPALKAAQTASELTLPELNRALTEKYGADAAFSDIQYQSANQLLEWSRQDRECTAMSLRLGFFQAVQNYRNSKQEYNNLVSEGKLLDNEANRAEWESKIKEETFNMLVQHHYLPDADYLSRFYVDYVENGDFQGFDKFMNGYTRMEDNRNRSAARFGAYGNTVKIGPVEVPMEYLLQSGKDLATIVDEIRDSDDTSGSFWSKVFGSNTGSSDKPSYSKRQLKRFKRMDDIVLSLPESDRSNREKVFNLLLDDGFYPSQITKYLEYKGIK